MAIAHSTFLHIGTVQSVGFGLSVDAGTETTTTMLMKMMLVRPATNT
jgi:hypothetical protein